MEKRFYYFPGQTLANTKVEERGFGLHLSDTEYRKITKHLDRKKIIQEALDKEEARRRYLHEGSKNMIKNWENSLENIRKRKEEARIKRLEDIKEDRMRRFFQIREEQTGLRKEYVKKVRKKMFMNSGWARDINSAYITTEVAFEREKQKELKKFIRNHEAEEAADYAKVVKENAQKEADENAAKVRKLYEERKEYGEYLRKVMEENEAKQKMLLEIHINKESVDNVKSIKEIQFLKRKEEEHKKRERREMNLEHQKHLKSIEELNKQLKQEEKEMDDVLAIYQKAKYEIDCRKKEKAAEKQESIIARGEQVAKLVVAGAMVKIEEEQKLLKTSVAEREANELEKIRLKAEYVEKLRKERLEDRGRYLERKAEQQRKEAEIKKWEMVNRYKIADFTKKYEEDKKKKLWQNILKRRQELLDQAEDDNKRRMDAKEMDECLSRHSFADADAKFFDYADEVLELAKKNGRSTFPIEKVILEYKKFNSLLPKGVPSTTCENIMVEDKKSMSREILEKSVKKRICRCSISK